MIIDAHTHIFPDQLAAEYLSRTAQTFNVPTYGLATAKDLLQQMDRNGVDYAVVHMVAPAPSGVRSTNDWLIDLQCERFIKSATLHPLDKNYQDEIQRLKDNNISIVKFQPDVQQFYPDDEKTTYGLYEALADNNIRVMFHVGGEPMPGPNDRSKPHMIKKVALDFPELTIVAAHLGGLNMWQEVYDQLAGLPNLYMESSLSYQYIEPAMAAAIIRKHGHTKFFFGTDYPFGHIASSLAAARSVSFLNQTEIKDILGSNAHAFFLQDS